MQNESERQGLDALRATADNLWLLVNVFAITGIARYGTDDDRRKAVCWLKALFGGKAFTRRRRSPARINSAHANGR